MGEIGVDMPSLSLTVGGKNQKYSKKKEKKCKTVTRKRETDKDKVGSLTESVSKNAKVQKQRNGKKSEESEESRRTGGKHCIAPVYSGLVFLALQGLPSAPPLATL
jgi:hypothetical protein